MNSYHQTNNALVIWLTGLSGSGKSTLANQLNIFFSTNGIESIMLDGDDIRLSMQNNKFDEASRKIHNLQVGNIAAEYERKGHMVVVSLISPYEIIRKEIRSKCKNFIEVFVSTNLETCIKRDVKGLYKKALNGEISNFTGISSPYELPQNPEIIIDTNQSSPEESSLKLIEYLRKEQFILF